MTSGFDGLSLALFTTLAPAGVVSFFALVIARFITRDRDAILRLDRTIALPFAVVLIGFIASATHLGTPANALHVFSGVGRSPLSNEVLAAVIFLFAVGSYWMMAFKEDFPDALAKPWLIVASIAGIALMVGTSFAYDVRTVPTWDTPFTPINLVLSALFAGPILGLLFLDLAQARPRLLEWLLLVCAALALVVGTAVLGLHQAGLTGIENNEYSAASLVPYYPVAIAAHLVLGILGFGAAALSMRRVQSGRAAFVLRIVAIVFVLAAVFVTRLVFYDLHMTLGF